MSLAFKLSREQDNFSRILAANITTNLKVSKFE